MSRLRIYDDSRAQPPLSTHLDHADIARELAAVGVRFEQWEATQPVVPGASQDEVIAAYRGDIDRLMDQYVAEVHQCVRSTGDGEPAAAPDVAGHLVAAGDFQVVERDHVGRAAHRHDRVGTTAGAAEHGPGCIRVDLVAIGIAADQAHVAPVDVQLLRVVGDVARNPDVGDAACGCRIDRSLDAA